MRMTLNQLSGNFTLESPTTGRLKWKPGKIMESSLELRDNSALKIAHLRSGGFPGSRERKMDVFVPCDGPFLDLVVLSGIAAKMSMKDMDEMASEAIQAVAGA